MIFKNHSQLSIVVTILFLNLNLTPPKYLAPSGGVYTSHVVRQRRIRINSIDGDLPGISGL